MIVMEDRFSEKLGKRRHPLGKIAAGSAFFFPLYFISRFIKITVCPVRNFLGWQCLGCGLSRGFIEIMHGNIEMASECHVLSLPLFVLFTVYYGSCLIDVCFGTVFNEKLEIFLSKKYMLILYTTVFIALVFWNISRNCP